MKKILAAILLLVVITTACGPVPTKSAPVANKNVLFSDDFTNTNSGWDRFQDYAGVTDYSNVGYLIYIKAANMIKWANPKKTFQNDVRIEVDATMSFGPDNNAFGVICRYQDKFMFIDKFPSFAFRHNNFINTLQESTVTASHVSDIFWLLADRHPVKDRQ